MKEMYKRDKGPQSFPKASTRQKQFTSRPAVWIN